ncbi:FAD-dependent oxidoreductase [Streptomyces sp. IBSNAI002]|uniref:FAD-dependent oxidoreductase n=1 Tax=Streptomyces sp. IBSNAI002 TaxID=3457500 RepID=UPI003FD0E477
MQISPPTQRGERHEPRDRSDGSQAFDVIVVGGGSAGIGAAVGAVQAGARTRLVEKHAYLGGAATASGVSIYCGFFDQRRRRVVAGVGEQVLRRLRAAGGYHESSFAWSGNTFVLLDTEITKAALDDELVASGVDLRLHSSVVAAHSRDGRVREVEVSDPAGLHRLTAASFVDASGCGVLASLAGAGVHVAPVADRQTCTLVSRIGGVRADADLSQEGVRKAVAEYNARTGLGLVRDRGVVTRMPVTGEVFSLLVDEHIDTIDAGERTRAEIGARRQARSYLEALRSGLTGWQDAYLLSTGPQLGIRESRRIIAREPVLGPDVLTGRKRPEESIARCGWPIEDHAGPGVTRYEPIQDKGWYDIPYGALCSADRENLWAAGRLVGSDDDAFTSLRVMGTAFATGHAAGVAAALAARRGGRAPEPCAVRAELLRQGALV